jgi:hypothetical protein
VSPAAAAKSPMDGWQEAMSRRQTSWTELTLGANRSVGEMYGTQGGSVSDPDRIRACIEANADPQNLQIV